MFLIQIRVIATSGNVHVQLSEAHFNGCHALLRFFLWIFVVQVVLVGWVYHHHHQDCCQVLVVQHRYQAQVTGCQVPDLLHQYYDL